MKVVKKILKSEALAILLLTVAVAVDAYLLSKDPQEVAVSLTEVGRRNPVLFKAWGYTTAAAFLANYTLLYDRAAVSKPVKRVCTVFLLIACVSVIGTSYTTSLEKIPHIFHWIFSYTFVVFGFLGFAIPIFANFFKSRAYRIITVVIAALMFTVLGLFLKFRYDALFENLPQLIVFGALYVLNFTKDFDMRKEKPDSETIKYLKQYEQ